MLVEAVLVGAVAHGTSILYATVGETVSERSGVINLGTEGSMLCGALAAVAAGIASGSPWVGALAGLAAGAAIAGVHAVVVLNRRANQIASGLAVTFLGLGITGLFGQSYVSQHVVGFDSIAIPGLSSLPFLGTILFDHDPLTYLSFVMAPATWWLLFRTRAGLAIRTAGERAEVLHTFGSSPVLVRAAAVVGGGALAGLGGAQLATASTLSWSEGMTVGQGFVAVALVIFARWNPLRAVAGAYLFSGVVALGFELQAQGSQISSFLLNMLPYLVVIAVLASAGRRRAGTGPAELDKVFETVPST